jgi:serine/threonine protein kinase/formylglycine-generating enzyme required for sulfatase activity
MENPAFDSQALPVGTRLEEFMIERVLGSGGFGITYLARDTSLGRQVVIKENLPVQFCFRDTRSLTVTPRHTQGDDAENFRWSLENFSREAALLASVDHPGIVRVLRSFDAFSTAYFVMPFVAGVTLAELIASRRAHGREFAEEELRGLLERALDSLSHLHDRGIYHRDIKPTNILITNEGVPVLIDFGSARQRLSDRSLTVIESPGYTPFEQLQSRGNVGPWSDLYALGGTLFRVLTGEAPPKANDRAFDDPMVPLARRRDMSGRYSAEFLRAIDRALAVRVADRWQNAEGWLLAVRVRNADLNPEEGKHFSTQRTTAEPAIALRIRRKIALRIRRKKSKGKLRVIVASAALILCAWAVILSNKSANMSTDTRSLESDSQALDLEATESPEPTGATMDLPFVNRQGMKFVPAGTPGVLFCVWETRVKDFRTFVEATGHDAIRNGPNGTPAYTAEKASGEASWKQTGGSWKDPRFPTGQSQNDLHPVVCVSYLDAEAFCAWLTKRDSAELPSGWRYRLPTDTEWSAACGDAKFPWGDDWPPDCVDGNYDDHDTTVGPLPKSNSGVSKTMRTDGWARTAPVGSFTQNHYGLFDMGGNAWEWCATWYQTSLNTAETLLAYPELKDNSGSLHARVVRGGAWNAYDRVSMLSACRGSVMPSNRNDYNGFRVVLARGGASSD